MKKGLLIALGVIVILGIWVYSSYNSIVTLNTQADAQWAQVGVAYQRRLDLIPNLVNSVKGAFTQEQTIISDVTNARTQYLNAATPNDQAAAATQVEGSLTKLLAVVESYPQLTSLQTVRDLMTELEGTENRISVERGRYNDIVQSYNTKIKMFPTNIIAGMLGFHERAYFQADAAAATAPVVNLQ